MSRHAPRRTSLLFPLVLATLTACQDSTAPRPLSHPKVQFAQGDNNTWTVNTLADPGVGVCDDTECTLREAVAAAAPGGNIVFASGLQGTIDLTGGGEALSIGSNLSIDGANRITLAAKDASRVIASAGPGSQITLRLTGLKLTGGIGSNGGGILAARTALILDRVVVSGNRAIASNGGGIYLWDSDASITASAITGNGAGAATGNSLTGLGGGIFVDAGSSLSLVNSTVDGNAAGGIGGGGVFNQGAVTITTSTISNNAATTGLGGGLAITDLSTASVVGSTFSGNWASEGAAISSGGSVELRSSTVTRNHGTYTALNGEGILVANSIVAGNIGGVDCASSIGSLGHNLTTAGGGCLFAASGDVTVQASQVLTEVLEQDLKDNGGPTLTHALIVRGRAVDRGYCPAENTDQRGFVRPVDDPLMPNAVDACDIGAYERQGPVTAVADLMISQAVDKPSAKQGDKVTYTIRVQNLGPETAPNVVVNDVLASGATFVEARSNRGTFNAPPKGETGTVTWTLGDMLNGANEIATITVTVIIKGKTTITNTASVTGTVADPNAANNSASIAVSVGAGGTTKRGGPTS